MAELIPLSGDYYQTWKYVAQDLTTDVVVYKLCYPNGTPIPNSGNDNWNITYTQSTKTWSDSGGHDPVSLSSTNDITTGTTSVVNPLRLYGFGLYNLLFEIESDWYQAPPNTNSVSNPSVSYVVADNELRIFIPSSSHSTEIAGTGNANRRTYYQIRKISGTNFFQEIAHTQGWPTNHTIVPASPGIYLIEKVLTNPYVSVEYNSVEVTQAQLDSWHSANNGHIYYDPSENYLHYFIHSSEDTTNLLFGSAGRELFYRVRSVNQSVHNFNHLHDYDTNGTYRPTAYGIYHLERVLTNPLEVLSYSSAEVSQSQLNAWNLLNAPSGDDSGNNAPPNTPRGRRGNHNFW
jgi:hypothetical protein